MEMKSFDLSKVQIRPDGSFVVNEGTYHVPHADEWEKLWEEIDGYIKEHPEVVERVSDDPVVPEIYTTPLDKAKAERARAVAALTVEVDGMVFDGDEKAQERMARTVTAATATGASMSDTTTWVLHDDTVAQVTIRQLATALRLAGEEQTRLWTVPYEASYTPAEAA